MGKRSYKCARGFAKRGDDCASRLNCGRWRWFYSRQTPARNLRIFERNLRAVRYLGPDESLS